MIYRAIAFALAIVGASAFAPARAPGRVNTALNANVMDTLASYEGPHYCWGSEGQEQNPPIGENEIKGYHRYGKFVMACRNAGVAIQGDVTIFAPTDAALDDYVADGKQITKELLLNHIVQGRYPSASINGDFTSMAGQTLKYERKFRKNFINEAIIGQADNFGGGSTYPTDIPADNGVIHPIAQVLEPGFQAARY
eukprot:CAMPEP_0118888718 /NCGR_PEP_ID=MMETSP1163-20130328/25863_1 /TAXON_ID=124430 /ORGANISM="Phaeomonas parva, Strain CCMP2877" /LENGTH=195 /DNA_ID=CAMNT_0006827289 /DNA_START=15 /DNA_END=602 /DNA_ORIENTATION=-